MGLFCNHGFLKEQVHDLTKQVYDLDISLKEALDRAVAAEGKLRWRDELMACEERKYEEKLNELRSYCEEYRKERRLYILEKQELTNRLKLLEGTNKYLVDTLDQISKCNAQMRLI